VAETIVEVRNLRFSYSVNSEEILKGLSFSMAQGEMVALTGPSGSGKSTLFYLLGCLLERYQGEVIFKGQNTRSLHETEKAWLRNQGIGFVFQQFYLLPRASVLENILLPAYYPYDHSKPTKSDRARVDTIAKDLGIYELLHRKPQELSGGQQQRVAIARALLRNPSIILADEPTGNLDSKSSEAVMDILHKLHKQGRTVVLITHSPEIANQCDRIIRIRDGILESDEETTQHKHTDTFNEEKAEVASNTSINTNTEFQTQIKKNSFFDLFGGLALLRSFPDAWANIRRSKMKAALTMLGVSLGVAAVLSTISLGSYAKEKILEGYEALGINTLRFHGYANWRAQRQSFAPAIFRSFQWQTDIEPLFRVFDEIEAITPMNSWWRPTISFAGLSFSENTLALGVNENYLPITGQKIQEGRGLSIFDLESGSPVCVIGAEVKQQMFQNTSALTKNISVGTDGGSSMPCRVVGVLEKQPSSQESFQPDSSVLLPFTYFIKATASPWERELREFLIKVKPNNDASVLGEKLQGYYGSRYGNTGVFSASSDAKLIEQMKLFLNVFSSLLTAVAVIALTVGGVGINNMMLVNLAERLKELGLRKALGATPRQLRFLVLGESLVLCVTAGLIGLFFGFVAYQGLVFAATKLIPKIEYAWIFEPFAFILSFGAILFTGIVSGLIPAMRAEKLDVMEALRQDA